MLICQIVWNIPYVLEYFEDGPKMVRYSGTFQISQNILTMATKVVICLIAWNISEYFEDGHKDGDCEDGQDP